MTQRQLADLSTVSVRAIRGIELGQVRQPRIETVQLLANGLGLVAGDRVDFEAAAGRAPTTSDLGSLFAAEPPAPPAPLEALTGRSAEVCTLREVLSDGALRLVTITGLAGVGKTRVALEVANALHSRHGIPVLWTSADQYPLYLTGRQPVQLSTLIRDGLDSLLTGSTYGAGGLASLVGDRPALLVLDGFTSDRLRVDRILDLVRHCRGLRVLMTASAPTEVPGERVFPLAPLPVPPERDGYNPAGLARVPSVQLILDRLSHIRPDFELTADNSPAVAALCRHVDGIPAALESVAASFLFHQPELLAKYADADPFDVIGPLAGRADPHELRTALRSTVSSLGSAEMALLFDLAARDRSWSTRDVIEVTGFPMQRCTGLLRHLVERGVVRGVAGTDQSRFEVLNLIRHVLCPSPPSDPTPCDGGAGELRVPVSGGHRNG